MHSQTNHLQLSKIYRHHAAQPASQEEDREPVVPGGRSSVTPLYLLPLCIYTPSVSTPLCIYTPCTQDPVFPAAPLSDTDAMSDSSTASNISADTDKLDSPAQGKA